MGDPQPGAADRATTGLSARNGSLRMRYEWTDVSGRLNDVIAANDAPGSERARSASIG